MDFSALLNGVQWALDAGCNQLENPCLPSFQLDVEASVDPVPTRMEDVQVAPEYDLMDLDLVVASCASTSESSFYPQPTAASGMVGLEDSCISPSSTSSSTDLVSMAFNHAVGFEDFQWPQSEESSGFTPAQSVAEECNAAPGIIITPPQPLVFTGIVPDQGFVVNRESAGFHLKIEPGKRVKSAPWTFSELMNKLFVDRNKMCPVTFKTSIPAELQGQFRVVVHVSFADLQDVHDRVRPCRNHAETDPELNPLMACHHPGVQTENRDGHHTAIVPLDVNKDGQLSAVAGFTFSCLNTCPSIKRKEGKNWKKRQLKMHFRLETRSGQMVDEKALDLKLCSCTGRDIKTEEEVFKAKS